MQAKQLYWDKGRLYVVTGFNQGIPAEETDLARKLSGRWRSQFELAQLMLKAGYVMRS